MMPLRMLSTIARREITIVLFIAMEVAWVAVALELLQVLFGLGDKPPAVWAMVFYPVTYFYFRMERLWRLHLAWKIALRTVLGALAMLSTVGAFVRPELFRGGAPFAWADMPAMILTLDTHLPVLVGVICMFAISRGWLLGPRQMDSRGFLAGFHVGLTVLFASVFGQHLAGLPAADMLPGLIVFFAFGLYGLGANRWLRSEVSARTASQAGWPLLGLGLIALILFVGAAFWTQVNEDTIRLLLAPVFWLWEQLVQLFFFLISLFPQPDPVQMPAVPQEMAALPHASRDEPFDWGETVRGIGRIMFLVSVTLIVAGALLRNLIDLLLWMSRRLGQSQGISYEHSASGLLDDLRTLLSVLAGFLAKLWRRFVALLRRPETENMAPEVRAIRGTYRKLLVWAGKRGWPKPASQTPNEFLDRLLEAVPHMEPDLAAITHSYVAVRYGSALPTPEAVRAVRASWRRVRKVRKRKASS